MGRIVIDGMEINTSGDVVITSNRGNISMSDSSGRNIFNKSGFKDVVDLRIEGVVASIVADGSVEAQDVHGNVDAGGSVKCGNVFKNVDSGGSATCQDVGGNVNAGGSATCGTVHGKLSAGGSIRTK